MNDHRNRKTYRRYSNGILVSWSILKCKLCGKFIRGKGSCGAKQYCDNCYAKHYKEYLKEYRSTHKEQCLGYIERRRKKRLMIRWFCERLKDVEL